MNERNFMICLKKLPDSGETCYNSLFQVKRTDEGLFAVCTNCSGEHHVNDAKFNKAYSYSAIRKRTLESVGLSCEEVQHG